MRSHVQYPLIGMFFILLGVACKSTDKAAPQAPPAAPEKPLTEEKYSAAFGLTLDTIMHAYHEMVGSFVMGDVAGVDAQAKIFMGKLDTLHFTDFQRDTVFQTAGQQLEGLKTEMAGLQGEKTLGGKRQELNMVSQDLYDLLRTIRYDRQKIYFTECTAAFGEDKPGDWISTSGDTTQSPNPYLGVHPSGSGGVVGNCAQIKDSLYSH